MIVGELEKTSHSVSILETKPVIVGCGKVYLFFKRVCDIIFSLAIGIVLLIPMLLVCILICVESEGSPIFKQNRVGKDGKIFVIYKFRTMRVSAPPEKASSVFLDSEKYITKFGQFLRRTSIDELPQLYNVLKGEMSLIGYRPVCVTEVKLNELRKQYGVFALRPGITGLAQVCGRDGLYYKDKAKLDAKYVENCSLKMDMWCLMKTVKTVLSGEGVR